MAKRLSPANACVDLLAFSFVLLSILYGFAHWVSLQTGCQAVSLVNACSLYYTIAFASFFWLVGWLLYFYLSRAGHHVCETAVVLLIITCWASRVRNCLRCWASHDIKKSLKNPNSLLVRDCDILYIVRLTYLCRNVTR
ncbi:hypothetical protein F4780DRAFT_130611 [Xylariomycetidae sp. FL0641]|nr:hypothetical protein F4780DRAFT_130611 [Xylariomycetidae sp. FL0641]